MTGLPLAEARSATHRTARTFSLACRLLPRSLRDDVYLLYLVLRTLDDLVDTRDPEAEARVAAVEAWALGAPAQSREARVLAALAERHPQPRHAFVDFCAGMRFDLAGGLNRTEAEVETYCYRVAGTVGLAMAAILGASDPRASSHAAALGMGMQRTNILRDIDEDRAAGRLYLAEETLATHDRPDPGAVAKRCCATRSPEPTRSTSTASPGSATCAAAAAPLPPPRACTPRSSARSSARATARGPAAPSCPVVASRSSPPVA